MDLSKIAKRNRDAVEAPLFLTERLIDHLEQIRTRIEAATKVWSETKRTLEPALPECDVAMKEIGELRKSLAELWKRGAASKWK